MTDTQSKHTKEMKENIRYLGRVLGEVHTAMTSYRSLVYETPGFADYFFGATPISEIAELNIGSRPAARKSTRRIEDLRAIPWGFSWGQCRLLLPGWFGLESAINQYISTSPHLSESRIATLKEMLDCWPLFKTLIANVDMVLAKTDLVVARHLCTPCGRQGLARINF